MGGDELKYRSGITVRSGLPEIIISLLIIVERQRSVWMDGWMDGWMAGLQLKDDHCQH